nr:Chain w, 27S pre-rRNA (guanosine(2922)-2'-O)-methyltransferase [Saccharomyces cerevisiae BY4741]
QRALRRIAKKHH